jgi:signal transduction histidine kinase
VEVSARSFEGSPRILARLAAAGEALEAHPGAFDRGTVSGTLETIARIVEDQNPGYRCSILLREGGRFVRGAGPSLPEEYNAAIDGEPIGPAVGSCGTAIYWDVPVVVEDIRSDPLWDPFRDAAAKAGVAACWSHPFVSSSGQVLGALALYYPEPRAPTEAQLESLRAAARMTGLAVERGRAEEALREQRRREAELEEQLRQAAKMEALGVLAGGVAHDFNNLLTTISGSAELALRQLPPGHPAGDELNRIVLTSQRAGEFCNQMLAYAGRGTLSTRRTELGALLVELRELAHAALSKKATLTYALHPEPIYLEADENQLLQVVLSLVTNAAEAVGDEVGHIGITTEPEYLDRETLARLAPDLDLPPGPYVRLTVEDDGQGMDAETRARIFDPFFTTKFTGRGLGLAAVTGIIRKHAGVIRVESEPGQGTTFEIHLPMAAGEEVRDGSPGPIVDVADSGSDVSGPASGCAVPRTPAPAGVRILVVDDEPGPRQVFRLLLEAEGFQVTEAVDGSDALEIFGAAPERFDCVLLDLSMPKLGGHETFLEIRAIRPDTPVVLVSGFRAEEILRRLGGAPRTRALQKPIRGRTLAATIRSVLVDRGVLADMPEVAGPRQG